MIDAWRVSHWHERLMFVMFVACVVFIVWVMGVKLIEYTPPVISVCERENPTAAMILDCQATRTAATIVAGDK